MSDDLIGLIKLDGPLFVGEQSIEIDFHTRRETRQIGVDIWWAFEAKKTETGSDFIGDIFQGPNAASLAAKWFAERGHT